MATRTVKVPSKEINFIVKVNATWSHRITITRRDDVPGQQPNLFDEVVTLSSGPGQNIVQQKGKFAPPTSLGSITQRHLIIDFKYQTPDGQWLDSSVGEPRGNENFKPITIIARDSFPDEDMDAEVIISW